MKTEGLGPRSPASSLAIGALARMGGNPGLPNLGHLCLNLGFVIKGPYVERGSQSRRSDVRRRRNLNRNLTFRNRLLFGVRFAFSHGYIVNGVCKERFVFLLRSVSCQYIAISHSAYLPPRRFSFLVQFIDQSLWGLRAKIRKAGGKKAHYGGGETGLVGSCFQAAVLDEVG